MNKSESKYFNTAARIDEVLISLLERKPFDYVTVKKTCEATGVNRSTFYLHYETVDDLLAKSVEYVNKRCFKRFQSSEISQDIVNEKLKKLILITPDYLIPYLEFIKENKALFRACVNSLSVLQSDKTFDMIFRNTIPPILSCFNFSQDKSRYVTAYYVNGLIAIVIEWLKNDCAYEISVLMNAMIKVTIPNGNGIISIEQTQCYMNEKLSEFHENSILN